MDFQTRFFKILLFSCFLTLALTLHAQDKMPFQFVSPKPGSFMVSAETNIILSSSSLIDQASLSSELLKVEGSESGIHSGDILLSDDDKTILFNPDRPFAGNEEVRVVLGGGIRTQTGREVPGYTFTFNTAAAGILQLHSTGLSESGSLTEIHDPVALKTTKAEGYLPPPPIIIDSINNPSEGYIFMATWDRNVPAVYGNFIFILDKSGAIVDSIRVDGAPYDFQVQPNGMLSYALGDFSSNVPLPGEELQHMVLDESLAIVDSFKMKNGYITDFHEFKMLPNGHVMMMSYHTIIYDMSTIVEGGKTDASLVINIIQEQDRDKNVVFEWRNIDYIPITDSDLDLTDSRINYGTLNAFDVDVDGNILASFRNHSEIMKISRTTGELIWRMGGPRGEFTYVGEHEENAPYYHARQHNIRRRPNGNITLFDNGQFHTPPYSRAVEYALDEENLTATLVSEWRYPDGNIFCVTAGNAEPLSNGGWFIGYGVPNPQFVKRNAVEVHPDGSIALEISLPAGVLAYRAYKFPWKESVNRPGFTHFEVREGNTYSYNNESITTGVEITYNSLSAADYNESTITRVPYGPVQPEFVDNILCVYPVSITYEGFAINSQSSEIRIDLEAYPEILDPENTIVFLREFPGQGLFIPRPTEFDSVENEIIATLNGFGELVFGVPESGIESNTPILYEPMNQQKLVLQDSIALRWTGKGFYDSFHVQVSGDSTFATVLYDANVNLSDFSIGNLSNNTKYFWRVSSELDGQSSPWTEAWSFEITDPYITVISPNGGESFERGQTEIIRWETNILEAVRFELIEDQDKIADLDTIQGSLQAYTWELSPFLDAGENFRIRIISESDPGILGVSTNVFSITYPTGLVEAEKLIPSGYSLGQNFPNPFSASTRITYTIGSSARVSLKIYDLAGKEVRALVNEAKDPGIYTAGFDASGLSGGIYFYELRVGSEFVECKKMIHY